MAALTRPRAGGDGWPALPLEAWEDTKETLHRYCQIVGKVRLDLEPPRNHWWHVPLYVTTRGLTTGPMPSAGAYTEVLLDLIDHETVVSDSSGHRHAFALHDGLAVAGFYERLFDALAACDVRPAINPATFDLGDGPRLSEDVEHDAYDAEAVRRFWTVLRDVELAYRRFGSRFLGKTSPIHLFWHSFDLAVTRFSGRRAAVSGDADPVTAQAYSHELTSFGFWAGDAQVREPAFYAYAWPEPPGLASTPLQPDGARWTARTGGSSLALLAYEDVRAAPDPEAVVLRFCESAYQAAARLAGWDVDALTATPADWTD
jgi:hypothetical protein